LRCFGIRRRGGCNVGPSKTLNLKLAILQVQTREDFETAFQSAMQKGEALLMLSSPIIGANTKLLLAHRLPAMTDGGLMAHGPNLPVVFRQGDVLSAKILQGAKPVETPIETPAKFELVIIIKDRQGARDLPFRSRSCCALTR